MVCRALFIEIKQETCKETGKWIKGTNSFNNSAALLSSEFSHPASTAT